MLCKFRPPSSWSSIDPTLSTRTTVPHLRPRDVCMTTIRNCPTRWTHQLNLTTHALFHCCQHSMTITTSYFQTTTFLLCHLHYLHIINNNNISLILSILLFSLSIYIKIRCFDLCPFSKVITYSLFIIYVPFFIIYVRKVVILGKKKGW